MAELEIVAASPAMRELLVMLERVAQTDANLLIRGESGTGKDLLAQLLHYRSRRYQAQLIKIDCSTLPQGLLESELFGYERGAFTGAASAKPGRFEVAHGGTLIFDEIVHLDLQSQAKLLRVIEERAFMRLGGVAAIKIDARFVTLTNMDLALAVARGLLRADLYHRLNVVALEIPPLRLRMEDLPGLVNYFLRRAALRHGKSIETISSEAQSLLASYEFPGNVRELQNIIERAVIVASGNIIGVQHLPDYMLSATRLIQAHKHQLTLAELEAIYIREVLVQTRGHKTRAAEILGISRKNLYEKLKKYRIKL
ncbi:MAG: sigma-54 dependent transcriptional regulator [Acidobacteriota bacterium]